MSLATMTLLLTYRRTYSLLIILLATKKHRIMRQVTTQAHTIRAHIMRALITKLLKKRLSLPSLKLRNKSLRRKLKVIIAHLTTKQHHTMSKSMIFITKHLIMHLILGLIMRAITLDLSTSLSLKSVSLANSP